MSLRSIKVSSELAGQELLRAKEISGHHGELSFTTTGVNKGKDGFLEPVPPPQ